MFSAELPSAEKIAKCNLTHLTALLSSASKGHYGRDKAVEIREQARTSIGIRSIVKELELQQTIEMIRILQQQIEAVENEINELMESIDSPITSMMVKRGSKYLRYAIFNATKYVCHWDPTFNAYLAKKRAEGKPYNVAVSHAAKKLTRVMFHLVKTNKEFVPQA